MARARNFPGQEREFCEFVKKTYADTLEINRLMGNDLYRFFPHQTERARFQDSSGGR